MSEADQYCHAGTPEELRDAVRDIPKMQKWVKPPRTMAELSAALDLIYIHHEPQRKIIEAEIQDRRYAETLDVTRKSNNLAKWAIVIAIAAMAVTVVQTFW